jgi:hypothetical protein
MSARHVKAINAELLVPCRLESCCDIDTCRCVFSCCRAASTRLMTSFSATATPASDLAAMQARVRAARLCMNISVACACRQCNWRSMAMLAKGFAGMQASNLSSDVCRELVFSLLTYMFGKYADFATYCNSMPHEQCALHAAAGSSKRMLEQSARSQAGASPSMHSARC